MSDTTKKPAPVSVPEGERRGRASGGVEPTTEEGCVVPGCEEKHGITHRTNSGLELAQEESQPEHLAAPRQAQRGDLDAVHPASGVATSNPGTLREATPEHPLLLAAHKRYLLAGYWGAISNRDPGTIQLAVKLCKEVGLDEVYKETVWQLNHRELHQAHKRAREIAVEAWEGMVTS